MSEFNLGDKVRLEYITLDIEEDIETEEYLILLEDVKEFIRRLKEDISNSEYVKGFKNMICEELFPIIDKLAGEKL